MAVNREPAIRRAHPAEILPERPSAASASPPPTERPAPSLEVPPPAPLRGVTAAGERLSETHNSRIRPSTKDRIRRAVDKLRYETGDRSISEASLTDAAIDQYLKDRGL